MKLINLIIAWYINFRLRKFDIYVTRDQSDLDQVYRLRFKIYCEELGFLSVSEYPEKKEKDIWDNRSITIVAKMGSKVVGALRIIDASSDGIPSDKYFPLNNYIPTFSKYAEISRFIIEKEFRKGFVGIGLIRELIIYGIEHNYDYYIITNSVIHENRYKKLGFYKVSKPYVYPLINDKYLAITMINNLKASEVAMKEIQPVMYELIKTSRHKKYENS
jgi:N-acyl-L-homoserine lactone synthetase